MAKFVHLHGHSEYSLLDGLTKIKKLVKVVKDLGMEAVAITDHGVMYGAIEFYKACIDTGIKPIIGAELYVARRSYKDKEGKADTEPYHLTVLAKNYQGYLNLMKLVSISHLEGFYYKPRVDKKLLEEFHEGLIALSGCPAGELIRAIEAGKEDKYREIAENYLKVFGEGNYYFEIQNHEYKLLLNQPGLEQVSKRDLQHMSELQDATWEAIRVLSAKLGIPVVATNDYHYIYEEDAEAQDALVCVQTGKLIGDLDRMRMIDTPNLYLKSPEEMKELFREIPESVASSVKIAQKCNIEIPLGKPYFPLFDIPQNKSPMEYLKDRCEEEFREKFPLDNGSLRERMEYELSVIEKKNYAAYFLVVADFVNWAHEQGIITNTRGSAAGSLVLYVLGVTNVDPIYYKLPFERFLNPQRPSLPDIDVDLADDRRDEVIRYVMDKYGHDRVAHITTFGTMMGRAAIRDIGRVLAIPYGEVDRIAKLVPPPHQGFHMSLDEAVKTVPELNDLYKNSTSVKKLIDLAKKVEGAVRHASVHAAGVVISPKPLTEFTPLQREANGDKVVTQYDMAAVEEVGLVKMDFLGLRNLSILGHAVEIVRQTRGVEVNLSDLPLDDEKTYRLLANGETMGVFQLEGGGMTKHLMELKPTNIFDIQAMVALYRPGPMNVIPEYIERKHNPKKVSYFDPRMKEYTEQSLGLLVYQDDVLLTAINLAGYSWEEADKFRKAMGKKIPAEMAKQKDRFIEGCERLGMIKERAWDLFKLIEPFAAYGFNKAHAASYAMTAYQTAYMKANFPVEFMAAVMTAESDNTEKIAHAIKECERLSIIVLPPDVNRSGIGFTLEEIKMLSEDELSRSIGGNTGGSKDQTLAIRFGLSAIKNVGTSAIESILRAREKSNFISLTDLCGRVDTRLVNKKTLESLIKAGALDGFGFRAAQLLILDQCLQLSHQNARTRISGQTSLFADEESIITEVKLPAVEELALEQLLVYERDLLGFYLHEPPYLKKLELLPRYVLSKVGELGEESAGHKLTLGGVVTSIKRVVTKRSGAEMAFVEISDGLKQIEVVVFPSLFVSARDFLDKDQVIIVTGKVEKREDNLSILAENILLFDPENMEKESLKMEIVVPEGADVDKLKAVDKALKSFPGEAQVTIFLQKQGRRTKMALPLTVELSPTLEQEINNILGEGCLKIIS